VCAVVLQVEICGYWQKEIYLRNFRGNFQGKFSIYNWWNLFNETGCILKRKAPFFVATMNRVQVALDSCRRNSTRQTARHLMSHEWRYTVILRIHLMSERYKNFDVLLTVHLSIFISVINQLYAQNFCFTISLFHASTCFEHMCSSLGGQNCITQPLVPSYRNK